MDTDKIRVLLIDDNPIDAKVIQKMLSVATGGSFPAEWVDRLSMGLERLAEGRFDALLLDLYLPDSAGLDTFIRAHSQAPEMPIVVLSGREEDAIAVEALQAGAQDFLVKSWINKHLLARALRLAVERKRAEEATKMELRMKSDFVSFATHQLRTPLAGINWLLELATQEPGISAEAVSLLKDARESAQRLIGLVNDLLDASRLESGRLTLVPQEISLCELTQSVLKDVSYQIQRQEHEVSMTADGVSSVLADPQLLRQAILNLVSNAIKYTPSRGRIGIHISHDNGLVRWAIQDSGIGIPKAAQARLFEKFFRADNVYKVDTEGTGLGLHLVRLIVERSGGRIWCESEENRGSTFIFTLPVRGGN